MSLPAGCKIVDDTGTRATNSCAPCGMVEGIRSLQIFAAGPSPWMPLLYAVSCAMPLTKPRTHKGLVSYTQQGHGLWLSMSSVAYDESDKEGPQSIHCSSSSLSSPGLLVSIFKRISLLSPRRDGRLVLRVISTILTSWAYISGASF